jgi:hypothetical protein
MLGEVVIGGGGGGGALPRVSVFCHLVWSVYDKLYGNLHCACLSWSMSCVYVWLCLGLFCFASVISQPRLMLWMLR